MLARGIGGAPPVLPAPTLASINPAAGTDAGGTIVTATGTNFQPGLTFLVGGVPADSPTFISSTQALFTTPPGLVGTANVTVQNPDSQSFTLFSAFTYSGAGGLINPLLFSDWNGLLGNSAAALRDGTKWDVYGSSNSIVSSAGLGFPANMSRVMEVPWYPAAYAAHRIGPTFGVGVGPLTIGVPRYYRWYFRLDQPNGTADAQTHPVQDGGAAGTLNWELAIQNNRGNDVFACQWLLNSTVLANTRVFECLTLFSKNTTYRFETMVLRDTTTTFKFYVRVFNEAISFTVPIFDEDDFIQVLPFTPSPPTMAQYFTAQSHAFQNLSMTAGLNAGCNDVGVAGETGLYGRQGGFVISENQGFNGRYGRVQGEVPV